MDTNTTMRDALIKTYHLESLPEEQQNDMIEKIGGLIFQAVLIRIAPQLTDTQQKELEMILDNDATPDELMGYLDRTVHNFSGIVAEEAENFKKESEAVMSQIGK